MISFEIFHASLKDDSHTETPTPSPDAEGSGRHVRKEKDQDDQNAAFLCKSTFWKYF